MWVTALGTMHRPTLPGRIWRWSGLWVERPDGTDVTIDYTVSYVGTKYFYYFDDAFYEGEKE